jgi:hypothetical protein
MKKKQEAIAPFVAGVAEATRRERGDFDGLLGQFDKTASPVLRDILSDLRGYLLDRYSDDAARVLLAEHEPRSGYQNVTPVPTDVALVLQLLNNIRSAADCNHDRFTMLILGKGGARDLARQAGTRKPRRPEVDKWIDEALKRDSSARAPALWANAPQWLTDQIGEDRFKKRVTAARKRGR